MGCFVLPTDEFALSEQVNWRDIKGKTVVLNIDSGVFYTLNEVGRFIWGLIADGHNFESITSQITSRFEVSPEQSQADAEKFIIRLMEENVLTIKGKNIP
jgi:hypothetical protein